MKPDKRKQRERKKEDKRARLAELRRRGEEKSSLARQIQFPHFDSIAVLSIGEGENPGLAHALSKRYLDRRTPGRVVGVGLEDADYDLRPNMSHVKGDAMDFLKSLDGNSVGRVHDHFATHRIGQFLKNRDTLDLGKSLAASASAHDRLGAKAFMELKAKWMERIRQYFVEVNRVLQPGGKLVLLNEEQNARDYKPLLARAGFRIGLCRVVDEKQAARIGAVGVRKWVSPGENLYAIIARKPR